MKKLVIVGASGHGKVIADIAFKVGYEEVVFLDDDTSVVECADLPVVGTSEAIGAVPGECEYIVAIGNAAIRRRIQESIAGKVATLVHPSAVISRRVNIGEGSVVMAGAIVNSDVEIGKGSIVNTCASVDHDCIIGNYVHVSVGAHVAGTVHVADGTWIGAGATVSNNVDICGDCMIGAGAVVVKDIDTPGTYIGMPARLK